MPIPFPAYFAGIGTVVAALGVGFGGAYFLMNANPPTKEKITLPEIRYEATKVEKVERAPDTQPPGSEPNVIQSEAPPVAVRETTGVATPSPGWVAEPPAVPAPRGTLPVVPYTAPIAKPSPVATPQAAPAPTERIIELQPRQKQKPDRKTDRKIVVDGKTTDDKRVVAESEPEEDTEASAQIVSPGPPPPMTLFERF